MSEIFRNFETSNDKNKRKVYEELYVDFKTKKNYYA